MPFGQDFVFFDLLDKQAQIALQAAQLFAALGKMAAAWVITLPAATVAGLAFFLLINALPHSPAMAIAVH